MPRSVGEASIKGVGCEEPKGDGSTGRKNTLLARFERQRNTEIVRKSGKACSRLKDVMASALVLWQVSLAAA